MTFTIMMKLCASPSWNWEKAAYGIGIMGTDSSPNRRMLLATRRRMNATMPVRMPMMITVTWYPM